MAATHFVNRCKFYATSTGTGDFVPESAVQGYLIPSDAGVLDTYIYSYVAETLDGLEWEIGEGTYSSGTTSFTRTPTKSSNSNTLVNFSTVPVVGITFLVNDFLSPTFTGPAVFNSTVTFNDTAEFNSTVQFDGTTSFTVPTLFADGTVSLPSITNIGDTNTGIYFSAADELAFTTAGTHAGLFDSSQRLILGHTAAMTIGPANATTPSVQLHGLTTSTSSLSLSAWRADTGGPILSFFKSRGPAVGTRGITVDGDDLGTITWQTDDGTNGPVAASILGEIDGTPGAGDAPGRLRFFTTPDGSTTPAERLRISAAGLTSVTGTFSVSSTSAFTGAITATSTIEVNGGLVYIDGNTNPGITIRNASDVSKSLIYWNSSTDALTLTRSGTNDLIQNSSNVWQINGNTVWHSGNDGTGSGLDADLLDGLNSTAFVTLAATSTSGFGWVIDEDTMSSNLDTKVPTQQSVKAYVDSKDTIGKQEIWIPASAMVARTTAGAAAFVTELATNDVMINGFDFDTSTVEGVGFFIALPKQWNEGTITFKAYWTAASGSGTVAWSLQGAARSDDDAMDQAYGTAQTSTDTLITANDVHVSPESSAITITGTPAAEDLCFFLLTRATGSDTLGVDARLLGIKIYITTDAGTDD